MKHKVISSLYKIGLGNEIVRLLQGIPDIKSTNIFFFFDLLEILKGRKITHGKKFAISNHT